MIEERLDEDEDGVRRSGADQQEGQCDFEDDLQGARPNHTRSDGMIGRQL